MFTAHLRPGEEQRPIADWDGYYVTNQGRVFSYKRQGFQTSVVDPNRAPRELKLTEAFVGPPKRRRRVLVVKLRDTRARAGSPQVSWLVAAAFIGPRPAGMGVLHWDDDPSNNRVGNLRYGSQLDNAVDARRNGRMPKRPSFVTCPKCGERGHQAVNCGRKFRPQGSRNACSGCGQYGHNIKTCGNPAQRRRRYERAK
jgi:hypothetical protein